MILHPDLEGVPLLILANKQDKLVRALLLISLIPTVNDDCYNVLQDALPLTEVESAFDTSVESIGDRDCKIQRISALKG